METKVRQFTSVIALFALSLGVFPFASALPNQEPQNLNLTAQTPIKIIVSEALPAGVVTSSNNPSQSSVSFSCIGGVAPAQTFVQSQAAVNLNQPADCFKLSVAANYQTQTNLSVQPLLKQAERVVVLPSARISSVYYHHAPASPFQAPVIPASVALMVFSGLAFGAIASKFKKISIHHIKQGLTLQQLQVMRC